MADVDTWSAIDRRAFNLAIEVHRHTQAKCADALRALGAPSGDQSAVSKWRSGTIACPSAPIRHAIRLYIEEAEQLEPGSTADAGHRADHRIPDDGFDADSFGADTSLLGRQGAWVDAMTERYRSGPPLSDADELGMRTMVRILGLD